MFRVPRKVKKKLKGKILVYSKKTKEGGSVMAFPLRKEEDYNAYKQGLLEPIVPFTKKSLVERIKKYVEKYHTEVILSDEELKLAVNTVFKEEYRSRSLFLLEQALRQGHEKEYFTFVNCYLKDSNYNICCMVIDKLEELM